MLFKLLGLPLTLPAAGIRFALNQVLKAAEAEMMDDAPVKEALLLLQLRLEEGEIDEEEYVEHEAYLMQRLREVRAYREQHYRELLAAQRGTSRVASGAAIVETQLEDHEGQ
jgi:hypothetical protein